MRIDDDELRDLFRDESEEHLQCLEQGLLRLESDPQDQQTLEQVYRAAHSLKGAAAMIKVAKVEAVVHRFEDLLGTARRAARMLTPDAIDRLCQALDGVRQFRNEALTGQPPEIELETVLQRLGDGTGGNSFQTDQPQSPADPIAAPPVKEARHSQPLQPPEPGPSSTRSDAGQPDVPASERDSSIVADIDTIRVPSTKLDALMSHAGELAVTRGRIAHRVSQVEQLLTLWEQWKRDAHKVRSLTESGGANLGERGLEQLRGYLQSDREHLETLGSLLKQLDAAVQADDTRVDLLASQLEDGIRSVRMLPLSTIFNLFPRVVRDLARAQDKQVQFLVEGSETAADKRILEELKDPLTHMIRNSIDHGLEPPHERQQNGKPPRATLLLRASQRGPNVVIEIRDDGAGIDTEAIKCTALKRRIATENELEEMSDAQIRNLIFAPGFSTKAMVTDVSGRGVGMDVVRANVDKLRGSIEIDSSLGRGTAIRLILPVTVATRRVLIVAVDGYKFAIPVENVQTCRLVRPHEVFPMQGRGTITLGGEPVSIVRLSELLELRVQNRNRPATDHAAERSGDYLECIILRVEGERIGFVVDELLDEQEVVLKPHGAILRRVRNVSGSTILETGEVCVTLNPHDLIRAARGQRGVGKLENTLPPEPRQKVVLLVEDSIVTRTQEKRILEGAGFEVITAVDGQEAYNKLATRDFDAVVSDVQMPNLNGLDLTARIRQQPRHKDLPVILLTSLATDEDRKRGMEVGADAYLTKPGFDQTLFLETVRRFA